MLARSAQRDARQSAADGKDQLVYASVVEKPPAEGHHFAFDDGREGKMEGRAIDTLGYRGMHSFEVSYADWFVPAENLVGEAAGL